MSYDQSSQHDDYSDGWQDGQRKAIGVVMQSKSRKSRASKEVDDSLQAAKSFGNENRSNYFEMKNVDINGENEKVRKAQSCAPCGPGGAWEDAEGFAKPGETTFANSGEKGFTKSVGKYLQHPSNH